MRDLVLVATIAACSGSARKELGPISDDAEAALREWCPALELQSRTAEQNTSNPITTMKGKPTLVFSCPGPKGENLGDREEGDVTVDANTRELLMFDLYLSPTSFDVIARRVLLPSLDRDARTALRELSSALQGKPKGTVKDWRSGGIFVFGRVDNADVPIWNIGVGPDQSK